jgi:hypothetical protein
MSLGLHFQAVRVVGSGTGQSILLAWSSFWQEEPTLLHLKVLFASPGMAAANPFSQGVYSSSGYRELSIAPDASSASH